MDFAALSGHYDLLSIHAFGKHIIWKIVSK